MRKGHACPRLYCEGTMIREVSTVLYCQPVLNCIATLVPVLYCVVTLVPVLCCIAKPAPVRDRSHWQNGMVQEYRLSAHDVPCSGVHRTHDLKCSLQCSSVLLLLWVMQFPEGLLYKQLQSFTRLLDAQAALKRVSGPLRPCMQAKHYFTCHLLGIHCVSFTCHLLRPSGVVCLVPMGVRLWTHGKRWKRS